MSYGYGTALEKLIIMTNNQYRRRGLADIQKQEVPTVFDRKTGKGFPREKSIVDFIGFYIIPSMTDQNPGSNEQTILQGRFMPVSFDAKETRSTTRFDLSNIYDHQYQYLKQRYELGTEAFLLINFVKYNQYFRLEFPELQKAWEGWKSGQRLADYSNTASIPYEWFAENLQPIKSRTGIVLDYLSLA